MQLLVATDVPGDGQVTQGGVKEASADGCIPTTELVDHVDALRRDLVLSENTAVCREDQCTGVKGLFEIHHNGNLVARCASFAGDKPRIARQEGSKINVPPSMKVSLVARKKPFLHNGLQCPGRCDVDERGYMLHHRFLKRDA